MSARLKGKSGGWRACAAAALLWAGAAAAPDVREAAERQAAARERVAQLMEALQRLIDRSAGRPEEASRVERLEKALARLREEGISIEMEEALRALAAGDTAAARARAAEAEGALREAFETLTREAALEGARARQVRAAAAAGRVERLAEAERELVAEAECLRAGAVPGTLRRAREDLSALARAQEALLVATAAAGGGEGEPIGALAERQAALARRAQDLAASMREVAREGASGGADAADPRQRAAAEAEASVRAAGAKMEEARGRIEGAPREAPDSQREAVAQLARARAALDRLERTFLGEEERDRLARIAARQGEIAREARQTAEVLGADPELPPEAARRTERAVDQMAIVEGLFQKGFVDSGIWEAERVLALLDEAAGRLREKERQYATEQIKVTLSSLQADVQRLIDAQTPIRKRTGALLEDTEDVWAREEGRLLAREQRDLAGGAGDVARRLADPRWKSTVYAWAAAEACRGMEEAADRLAARAWNEAAACQDGVLALLWQMREGLKTLLGRLDGGERRPTPRGMAATGDQEIPLVSPADEVRLLWNLQLDLNARWNRLAGEIGEAPASPAQRAALARLVAEQERIRTLGNEWRFHVYQEQR